MVCSIVQPQQVGAPSFFLPALENETNLEQQKFIKEGCPNCEDAIHLRNNSEKVEDCTSPVFEGLVALWQPKQSWVSRWQRVDGFVRGMYAIKVSGNVCFLKAPPQKKKCFFFFFENTNHRCVDPVQSYPRRSLSNWRMRTSITSLGMGLIPTIGNDINTMYAMASPGFTAADHGVTERRACMASALYARRVGG